MVINIDVIARPICCLILVRGARHSGLVLTQPVIGCECHAVGARFCKMKRAAKWVPFGCNTLLPARHGVCALSDSDTTGEYD